MTWSLMILFSLEIPIIYTTMVVLYGLLIYASVSTNKTVLRNKYKAFITEIIITTIYIIKYIYVNLSTIERNATSLNQYLTVIMCG